MDSFTQTAETAAGLRYMQLKASILALSLSTFHIENGDNTVEGVLKLYEIDGYNEEEVIQAINELATLQLITTS